MRRKSKNHASKITGIDTGPPTLVNVNTDIQNQLQKAISTLTENLSNGDINNMITEQQNNKQQQQSVDISPWLTSHIDKLIKQTSTISRYIITIYFNLI